MEDSHFSALAELIADAEAHGLLAEARGLTGYSGDKLVGALQRFARYQDGHDGGAYLEVGVFQGLTLVSVAAAAPAVPVYGIDNFAQFDPDGENEALVQRRAADNAAENARVINADYEDALEVLTDHIGQRRVGVYFVDGPHDYRSQLMCLELIRPYLSERAIIVVDDSNYRHVRQANRDFLAVNPEYKLFYEAYTRCHPKNADASELEKMRRGWWNGVNMLVRDRYDALARDFPPTFRDRTQYENEHVVQAARHGYLAPQATLLASALMSLNPWQAISQAKALVLARRRVRHGMIGSYPRMNTFSQGLPGGRFNSALK
ncbi:class I SAM-dependent methyltransferase [Aquisalimonas lutea]|uniref:class I SAM-dependent methyltransferase n=1 Tax=Aquisalimonas lutea TaxID=1327750 RepID=UPI0025B5DB47|nr:class I SAM-dependent methyltransferase [Aquisalimonas lutea]MDN3517823.1 class I SAM-dependent methyltransferase [Aquisalimonas lutea]